MLAFCHGTATLGATKDLRSFDSSKRLAVRITNVDDVEFCGRMRMTVELDVELDVEVDGRVACRGFATETSMVCRSIPPDAVTQGALMKRPNRELREGVTFGISGVAKAEGLPAFGKVLRARTGSAAWHWDAIDVSLHCRSDDQIFSPPSAQSDLADK